MARFEQGFRTLLTAQGAVLEIIAGAGGRIRLVELGLSINAQTLTTVGLGYPAAIGQTPSSPVTFLSQDIGTTVAQLALGWTTPPTAPTGNYYFRRATLGLASDELVWKWPAGGGILILPATSLALFLFATGSVLDGWVTLEQ